VKDLLNLEIRRLQSEIDKREGAKAAESNGQAPVKTASATGAVPHMYTELIKSYGMVCFVMFCCRVVLLFVCDLV